MTSMEYQRGQSKTWHIFLCKHLPFLHAFLGCDTTSRLFGIGKGFIIKKFRENKSLQQAAIVFDNPNATQAQMDHAGEAAFVVMYNGKKIRYLR